MNQKTKTFVPSAGDGTHMFHSTPQEKRSPPYIIYTVNRLDLQLEFCLFVYHLYTKKKGTSHVGRKTNKVIMCTF